MLHSGTTPDMFRVDGGPVILLLQADVGAAESVAAAVSLIPGVVGTAVTSGPYDVIGHVDRDDVDRDRLVLEAVRRVDGLSRLCVCRSSQRREVR